MRDYDKLPKMSPVKKAEPLHQSWFENHLGLTFFLAWIIGNLLVFSAFLVDEGNVGFWILLILAIVLILGTEVWYLLKKKRSLFFLFLNLVGWIGLIILLMLDNKAIILEEVSDQPKDVK